MPRPVFRIQIKRVKEKTLSMYLTKKKRLFLQTTTTTTTTTSATTATTSATIIMASRDLTSAYLDRRATALKRRNALGSPNSNGIGGASLNGSRRKTNRLTAGGSMDDGDHSLMLMEVRVCCFVFVHEFLVCNRIESVDFRCHFSNTKQISWPWIAFYLVGVGFGNELSAATELINWSACLVLLTNKSISNNVYHDDIEIIIFTQQKF